MPTTLHQCVVSHMVTQLDRFAGEGTLGWTLPAGIPVRLPQRRKYREPDVVFMLRENRQRIHENFWDGADLVMEVVSGSTEDRRRDLVTKKTDYARAKISEYWIVEPDKNRITVLWLQGKRYKVDGVFKKGQQAASRLLPGFQVDVAAALAGIDG